MCSGGEDEKETDGLVIGRKLSTSYCTLFSQNCTLLNENCTLFSHDLRACAGLAGWCLSEVKEIERDIIPLFQPQIDPMPLRYKDGRRISLLILDLGPVGAD